MPRVNEINDNASIKQFVPNALFSHIDIDVTEEPDAACQLVPATHGHFMKFPVYSSNGLVVSLCTELSAFC